MRDLIGAARAYLAQNPLLFANMLEVIDRGSARLLAAGAEGVLLFEEGCGCYMMSAKTPAAVDRMLALIPDCRLFVGHEPWYQERVAARYGLTYEEVCYQAAWMRPQPPALPPFSGTLRPLDASWAETVAQAYSHPASSVEFVSQAIDRGMTGAFLDGALAGFIGFHSEGSLGLLEVLPAYRRRGVGLALLLAQTRLALARGQRAFGQIFTDNAASVTLHQRAGFDLSKTILFWLS